MRRFERELPQKGGLRYRRFADNEGMNAVAIAPTSREIKSFRLARPVAAELTACAVLALVASGAWLLVLPLELLRAVSA